MIPPITRLKILNRLQSQISRMDFVPGSGGRLCCPAAYRAAASAEVRPVMAVARASAGRNQRHIDTNVDAARWKRAPHYNDGDMRATLFLLASLLPALAQDRITYISGATLIDGNGGAPVADSAVIVRGKKIEKVGTRAS